MTRMAVNSVITSTAIQPLQGNGLWEFLVLFQSVFKNPCKLGTILSPFQSCMECGLMHETAQLRGPPWLTAMLAVKSIIRSNSSIPSLCPSSLSLSLSTPLPSFNLSKRQAYSCFWLGKIREEIFSNLLTGLSNCFMHMKESLPLSVSFIELIFSSLTPV